VEKLNKRVEVEAELPKVELVKLVSEWQLPSDVAKRKQLFGKSSLNILCFVLLQHYNKSLVDISIYIVFRISIKEDCSGYFSKQHKGRLAPSTAAHVAATSS
jgi:hypothetical protein